MKQSTYYIQNKKGVCIKANNIKGLLDYCLPAETVRLHLKLQRMKMKENESYRPQPIVLKMEEIKMKECVSEIKKKVKDLIFEDTIALQTQSNNIPVILIITKKENHDIKETK